MPTNKQRREAARRHLERQLQRRQEREAARKRFTLIASIVGTIVLVAVIVAFVVVVSGEDDKTPAASGSSGADGTCAFTAGGTAAKEATLPPATPPKTGTVTTTVKTSQGNLTFKLDRSLAPCTVASFLSLVQQKYYDNTPCHRVVTSDIFVLQCGDPTGKGTGGPGYTVPDEATGSEAYPAATIAMARSAGVNTGGSQFFIVYKDSPNLAQNKGTEQYTVFGTVTAGMDVVNKVAKAGAKTGTDGEPKLPIKLTTLTAVESP